MQYVIRIIEITVGPYLVSGFLFYLFMKNLLRNADGHLILSVNSWHFKLAYPFRKFLMSDSSLLNKSFFVYFSKIYYMVTFGWPILIALQTIKMVVGTPLLLFIFGLYLKPGLRMMQKEENPFAMETKELYIPSICNGFQIFPIYIVLVTLFSWLAYRWPYLTIGITLVITGLVTMVLLIIYLCDRGLFKSVNEWFIKLVRHQVIKKYNFDLKIKKKL